MFYQLDFEQPIREIEERIADAERRAGNSDVEVPALGGVVSPQPEREGDVGKLHAERDRVLRTLYRKLSPWDTVRVARHPNRPFTQDYLDGLFTEWAELHGDRAGHDDAAITGGMARLGRRACVVIGHQKGRNTNEHLKRNFGMARPEGYRKALRLMKLA